jgi:nucleoside-diphosphate-sugar epimerase
VIRLLVERGYTVAVFHRGETEADLPAQVAHVHGDRHHLAEYRDELARLAPDVVLDTRPLTEEHARTVMSALDGVARRVVALSSGDVYRAYGVFRGTEAGPYEPVPLAEDAPLRQRRFPYRGPTARAPDDPLRWTDDYEKLLVERTVMDNAQLPGTILRLPMIYGPGDEHHRLFEYLKRMDDRRPAIILDDLRADWRMARGYVEDVGAAIVAAVVENRAAGRIYNVSAPDTLTEAGWVKAIGQAAGWRGEVVIVSHKQMPGGLMRPGDYAQHLVYDTGRIREELGFAERLTRAEGLERAVAWERSHPPEQIGAREFDYDLEDEFLRSFGRIESDRSDRSVG